MELSTERIAAYRAETYRILPGQKLASKEEAVQYVNERGFILFWPNKGTNLPSLWSAVAGNRPVADEHDDPGHVTWGWKDSMLGKKAWYYGRILRKKNCFLSLKIAPYFYALSPNYGDYENDYLDQYEVGSLTMESRNVYEALLREGVLDTISLRKAAHLSAEGSDTRFQKAVDALQVEMKVMPVGVAEVGAWKYAFQYDIVARHMPEIDQQARSIDEDEARDCLIMTYLQTTGAASPAEVQRLFGWRPEETRKTIARLLSANRLKNGVTIPEQKGEFLCLPDLL